MSQSTWQKQKVHLDKLQSMVNAILIETGKALRTANAEGPKTIGLSHDRLQTFLPSVVDKFHFALDELEIDIVKAQAVLNRDLTGLRAKQYELDNPQEQTLDDAMVPDQTSAVSELSKPVAPEAIMSGSVDEPSSTVIKEEIQDIKPTVNSPELAIDQPTNAVSPSLDLAQEQEPLEIPPKSEDDDKIAIAPETDVSKDNVPADEVNALDIDLPDAAPSASSEAPAAAGLPSASFDNLFDMGNAGDTDLNFDDFDFNTGHETQSYDHNDGGLDLSSFGNQPDDKNDDVNELLQGLESYADGNGSGDFHTLDLPNDAANNTSAEQGVSGTDDYGMSGAELDLEMGIGNNESTFDDLLEGMDIGFEESGTGGDMMENDEFGDAYFRLNDS